MGAGAAVGAGTAAAAGGLSTGTGLAVGLGASGLLSGLGSLFGSSQSSSAAKEAAQTELSIYEQNAANLSPYNTAGQSVLPSLETAASAQPSTNYLAKAAASQPTSMLTEAGLQQAPGYQFQLNQGLKAVQSANAAKGLGVSGASLKGAATYATGLADSNYQNMFNDYQTQFQNYLNLNTAAQSNLTNTFNRLSGVASLGEGAAAQTAAQGTQAGAVSANYLNQAGLDTAAGTTGATNAITGAANNYLSYSALQSFLPSATSGLQGSQAQGAGTSTSQYF